MKKQSNILHLARSTSKCLGNSLQKATNTQAHGLQHQFMDHPCHLFNCILPDAESHIHHELFQSFPESHLQFLKEYVTVQAFLTYSTLALTPCFLRRRNLKAQDISPATFLHPPCHTLVSDELSPEHISS